jgi:nitrogenase molybdenum-iron protein alpha/beta subunit
MVMFSTFPDSLTGAVLAIEGIEDAAVILNGPTGCKFYHGSISEAQYPRVDSLDPIRHAELYYFGQPRVPCTYLDGEDYVYGSESKITSILPNILLKGHSLIGIINSPGASLIGDEISRIVDETGLGVHYITMESTGFTGHLTEGFQKAVIATLNRLLEEGRERVRGSVNLLGLSLYQANWEGSIAHLREMLGWCGLDVIGVICAGTSFDSILKSTEAELNIVVHEEYSKDIAAWYQERYGTPNLISEMGAPIGFDSIEAWIRAVGNLLKVDISPAMERISEGRRRCHKLISRFNSLTGLPKGSTFAIRGDPSLTYPITRFLHSYLGMVPECVESSGVSPRSPCWEHLERYLESNDLENSLRTSMRKVRADLVLGDGNLVSSMVAMKKAVAGITISLPLNQSIDLVGRPMLGLRGTLHLLENVLNGLCGDRHLL